MPPAVQPRALSGAFAKALKLCGRRLSRSLSYRAARSLVAITSVVLTASAVYLGAKGDGAYLATVTERAALVHTWITMVFVAWWASADRSSIDEADGIAALARCHGIGASTLPAARAVAASIRASMLVFVPTVAVVVATVAVAPTLRLALGRALSVLVLALYAIIAGVIAGGVGSICGVIAPRRGRWLMLALVAIPWSLDSILIPTHATVGSIPGVLAELAHWVAQVGGAV